MAHLLPINKKEFYIELQESRYYFPGDVVKGTVVLNLGKPTKTNHIRITLTGTVQADGSTAQILHDSWCLATSPLNDGKPHLLEAQTHRFPFEFNLPNDDDDIKLPSSLKLSKSMAVKYAITAIHDRPYVPERLCSAVKKEIRVLERIDITLPKYGAKGYVTKDVRVFGSLPMSGEKVHLSLTLPQYAVVRGDILPMEICIKHYRKLCRVDGIKVHLIRRVYTGKGKDRKKAESKSIKSNLLAIDITSNGEFEQKISTKLLVPTHTPPTLSQNGRILAVEYAARVVININDSYAVYGKNYIKLESHVVIGTFPKPSLSIDDDDDDDNDDDDDDEVSNSNDVDGSEDMGVSDDDDDLDDEEEEEKLADTKLKPCSDSSSSAHIVEPPAMRQPSSTTAIPQQQQQQQQSSTSKLQQHDVRNSPALPPRRPPQQLQQRHQSSSSSLMVVEPSTPSLSTRRQHSSASSSPSLTVVDPTVSRQPQQRQYSSASSSPSLTVVAPPVPAKEHQRPILQQQQHSSSSSLTVVDPTAPTVSMQTERQHSYLPRQSSLSAMVIDPTTTHDSCQHAHHSPSALHRHSLQHGAASVADPMAKLHRNESTFSTLSSLSSASSRSSSSAASSSATLVEPRALMKPDRNTHATPSPFTPTSPTMATMPDISAYVPSKSSGLQQKKRPALHINPIASSAPHQPSSPAATVASPGGFVMPMPIHTPQSYPPPLPPRRPSAQPPPPPPPYYYQHPSNPPYPWS